MRQTLAWMLLILALPACQQTRPENPSFPLTRADAKAALKQMRAEPKPLARPLVILSGFRDPGTGAWWVGVKLDKAIDDDRVLTVGYFTAKDLDAARTKVIAAVDEAFPADDPHWTTEVDVIGISLGGLVGRYAAMPSRSDPEARRLRLARLFTLSSPHRGAVAADKLGMGTLMKQLQTDSDWIAWINANDTDRAYKLYPYVRLGDPVVGAINAAPDGVSPWWLANEPLEHAHIAGTMDVRFQADILRRLREEPPYAVEPPAPLPASELPKD